MAVKMDDWGKLQELGHKEMESLTTETRVRLRMFGGKITGSIIDVEPPIGLLAPRYKCLWDNGEESQFLSSSKIETLK